MTDVPAVDPSRLNKARTLLEAVMRVYHRAEATGVENLPHSGALLVGNHSGGIIAMDVPAIALAYWKRFGVERPLHVLAHDLLTMGPLGTFLGSLGFVKATRENAQAALRAGGATIVFPGGDFDVYRPTSKIHTIDFNGRTGYVRTAVEAGVPIVPVVSIGGHETQLVLSRGEALAKHNPIAKLARSKYAPITFGFPWGLTMGLPQLPLPSKIVTRFLEPIDPAALDNDVEAIDALVRERMQSAMDELAAERRFPIVG
ncbi:MAG: acyltransferase family protein [Frankiales bacterium]|nr:acyltransferase family protein [Frankiales bacterium]